MTKKKRAAAICCELNKEYGTEIPVTLKYDGDKPWQLLFATMLSAQCTDERVNSVTEKLFIKYPSLVSFAEAEISELERDIYSIGFYHSKAYNIIRCANALIEQYDSEIPSDIDELISLPGVGRKTANVVRGHIFNIPSIVVDTHVKRISRLVGLTDETDPEKIEYDLMKTVPKNQWILYNLQMITHGRKVCIARRPCCTECVLKDICVYNCENEKKNSGFAEK